MCYGDDYVYSFIWDGSDGWNIYQPLPETAERVESLEDLWNSMCSYYTTWGGRIIGTVLSQFFLWQGKELFNFFNSVVFLILVLEIYYISEGGELTGSFNSFRILWIFFALWAFVPGFNGIVFWLVGSCYYLWTMVMVLAFLIPYVKAYLSEGKHSDGKWKAPCMFLFGAAAGCTNENMICWLILIIGIYCRKEYKERKMQSWMAAGWIGLVLGYAVLLFAPGNLTRIFFDVQATEMQTMDYKLTILAGGFLFQFLLWYFVGSALRKKDVFGKAEQTEKMLCLIRTGAVASAAMLLIMLLSPEFPLRSVFPSTVFLIITAGWLMELDRQTGESILKCGTGKFLRAAGTAYMLLTMSVSAYAVYETSLYADEADQAASALAASGSMDILELPPRKEDAMRIILSGVHNTPPPLKSDENHWNNVAYARYWGIRGVKTAE